MLNVTKVLISIVCERALEHFRALYGAHDRAPLVWVEKAASTALSAIGNSDALYHNVEHTTHVTLVGLEILRAKQQSEHNISAGLWANTVVALLCHDIGYVRGLCRADSEASLASGTDGAPVKNLHGSSDAQLMPVHVNRGKRFVEEQFLSEPLADIGFINACIERTRFPVPDDPWYAQTADFPGLVRAADLIGQLSDPRYLSKLAAIFYEFEEVGFNQRTGYARPGDLLTGYPEFFDNAVEPYIREAVCYLRSSEAGRDVVLHLYRNLATAREAVAVPLASAASY